MFLHSLISVGAFGLAAQAFLIPEINSIPEADNVVPTTLNYNSQTVELDCSTCPFALNANRNGAHEWTADVESDLVMNFDSDGKSLRCNGVPVYPITASLLPPTLFVSQKKRDGQASSFEGLDGKLRLSYSMEYDEKKFEENSLVTMVMIIMGLDGQMVRIDDVEIKAIKSADETLTIHSITTIAPSPDSPDAKCGNVLCRVFTKLLTGVAKAKASAKGVAHKMKCLCVKCFHKLTGQKHPHHHANGMLGKPGMPHRLPDGTIELPSHIHGMPTQFRHHGHHHHKGFLGRVVSVLRTTFHIVFVPILIGIAFGMAASAIGMLAGQAVVWMWMKLRRTPEAAYEPLNIDEKEAPPEYQDAPAAEAINEKKVEAKV